MLVAQENIRGCIVAVSDFNGKVFLVVGTAIVCDLDTDTAGGGSFVVKRFSGGELAIYDQEVLIVGITRATGKRHRMEAR